MNKKIYITKSSGESQLFSESKLRRSLRRTKASAQAVSEVMRAIEARLHDGMTTKEIYDLAYRKLRENRRLFAARYSLKRAIMDMGPSGHPFEHYVAELMKMKGYTVQVGQIITGQCVTHEVDVIAQKGNERLMVECKFHNQPGVKSDVKVALYVRARFEDIVEKWKTGPENKNNVYQAWLVTNTELTTDAIRYAECSGMKAIGWNYPPDESLGAWVESSKLHPVTCLTTLSGTQKNQLLENKIILCRDIYKDETLLRHLDLSAKKEADLLNEIQSLGDLR